MGATYCFYMPIILDMTSVWGFNPQESTLGGDEIPTRAEHDHTHPRKCLKKILPKQSPPFLPNISSPPSTSTSNLASQNMGQNSSTPNRRTLTIEETIIPGDNSDNSYILSSCCSHHHHCHSHSHCHRRRRRCHHCCRHHSCDKCNKKDEPAAITIPAAGAVVRAGEPFVIPAPQGPPPQVPAIQQVPQVQQPMFLLPGPNGGQIQVFGTAGAVQNIPTLVAAPPPPQPQQTQKVNEQMRIVLPPGTEFRNGTIQLVQPEKKDNEPCFGLKLRDGRVVPIRDANGQVFRAGSKGWVDVEGYGKVWIQC
ncbi:hypothetical protein BZA77DRAFT_163926 [Pyronema omphalodes]|nr:hypothetical protein BZA77DRAFT_163926 [Pyronema omphalodes]